MNKKILLNSILVSSLIIPTLTIPANAAETTNEITTKTFNGNIPQKVLNKNQVKHALKNMPNDFALKKNLKQYDVESVNKDKLGHTHYTLVPRIKNIPIANQKVKVHVNDRNEVIMINGNIDQDRIIPKNKVKLSQQKAINTAYSAIGISHNQVQTIDHSNPVQKAELNITPELDKYVYDVQISYITPSPSNWHIQIDAETGTIISKQNKVQSMTNYTGRGIGYNNSYRPLHFVEDGGLYHFANYSNPTHLEVHTANHTDNSHELVKHNSRIVRDKNKKAAVDAAYFMEKVYQYYKNVHDRESYDNQGTAIYSIVNYDSNYNNAAWTGNAMIYGDGDGQKFAPLSGSRDITAHELSHAVTNSSAKLVYHNQSGAIDEHFADVFGFFNDPEDWFIAEDVYTPGTPNDGGLRSLKNPEEKGMPKHMNEYWYLEDTEAQDWGGVHINANILNRGFYELIDLQNMDIKKAEQIYYRTLTVYLTPYSQFSDMKELLMQSARDLYSETEVQQINAAYTSVGVN